MKEKYSRARLLAGVFNIDVETCSKCGGKMKIIANRSYQHQNLPTTTQKLDALGNQFGLFTRSLSALECRLPFTP